uniref:Small ribosomal subunit protein uS7c n=1 Tax=Scotinosphaera sp. NIES-154 TaxID=2249731 RepID=A0A2Z4MAF9_9CHLO|nr:ribosomal protein S7 [Scotinosphaera sp. NIES-154]
MSRRQIVKKRYVAPDPRYESRLVQMIVNRLMKKGKKALAYKIIYETMDQIANMTKKDPVKIIEQAIRNATPLLEVKARRVGGSTYQIPKKVPSERGTTLSIRWILSACRNRSGKSMIFKLTNEFIDASKKTGDSIRKRNEAHRMAEANRALAKVKFDIDQILNSAP